MGFKKQLQLQTTKLALSVYHHIHHHHNTPTYQETRTHVSMFTKESTL